MADETQQQARDLNRERAAAREAAQSALSRGENVAGAQVERPGWEMRAQVRQPKEIGVEVEDIFEFDAPVVDDVAGPPISTPEELDEMGAAPAPAPLPTPAPESSPEPEEEELVEEPEEFPGEVPAEGAEGAEEATQEEGEEQVEESEEGLTPEEQIERAKEKEAEREAAEEEARQAAGQEQSGEGEDEGEKKDEEQEALEEQQKQLAKDRGEKEKKKEKEERPVYTSADIPGYGSQQPQAQGASGKGRMMRDQLSKEKAGGKAAESLASTVSELEGIPVVDVVAKINDPWYVVLKEASVAVWGFIETLWFSGTVVLTSGAVAGTFYMLIYELWWIVGWKKPFKIMPGESEKLKSPDFWDHVLTISFYVIMFVSLCITIVGLAFIVDLYHCHLIPYPNPIEFFAEDGCPARYGALLLSSFL